MPNFDLRRCDRTPPTTGRQFYVEVVSQNHIYTQTRVKLAIKNKLKHIMRKIYLYKVYLIINFKNIIILIRIIINDINLNNLF